MAGDDGRAGVQVEVSDGRRWGGAGGKSGQEQLAFGAEPGLVKCQGEGKHGAGA